MKTNENIIKDMLKSKGLKLTPMHISILSILLMENKPMSRTDVLEALGDDGLDKVTVYRVLERFCEKGIANKLEISNRAWLYELADNSDSSQQHPHFKCINCGRIYCLEDVKMPPVSGLSEGFISLRQKLVIEGIGPECR